MIYQYFKLDSMFFILSFLCRNITF